MAEVKAIVHKTKSSYISSLVFLFVVVIITITMYFYNSYTLVEIEKIKNNINSIESSIAEVEKNKQLQIYSLLELNKEVIKSYEIMNKVTKYINHMNVIGGKYNLKFTGFDLSNGNISTNINIVSDDDGIAFQKTRDFINKYRIDDKALFDLSYITNFEGMDEIKFKVNFKIK